MPLNWPAHRPIETVSWTTPLNVSMGWVRVLPTVCSPVAQFNPIQQPLMAVGIVPIAVCRRCAKRTFGDVKENLKRSHVPDLAPEKLLS